MKAIIGAGQLVLGLFAVTLWGLAILIMTTAHVVVDGFKTLIREWRE